MRPAEPHPFDEAKARALLTRLASGEPITAILRDPAMPSRRTYAYWRATQGEFQGEVYRLNDLHRRARSRTLGLRRVWPDFDPAVADKIVVRVSRGEGLGAILADDPALPSRTVVSAWRRAQPDFATALAIAIRIGRRNARDKAVCPPDLAQEICDAIRQGESLASLARRPNMPSAPTLYSWVRTRPAFADAVRQACDDREDWYLDQANDALQPGVDPRQGLARVAAIRRALGRLQNRPGNRARRRP